MYITHCIFCRHMISLRRCTVLEMFYNLTPSIRSFVNHAFIWSISYIIVEELYQINIFSRENYIVRYSKIFIKHMIKKVTLNGFYLKVSFVTLLSCTKLKIVTHYYLHTCIESCQDIICMFIETAMSLNYVLSISYLIIIFFHSKLCFWYTAFQNYD